MTLYMSSSSRCINNYILIHDLNIWYQHKSVTKKMLYKKFSSRIQGIKRYNHSIRVITKVPNTEQSSKGKVKTHKSTNKISQQPGNWETVGLWGNVLGGFAGITLLILSGCCSNLSSLSLEGLHNRQMTQNNNMPPAREPAPMAIPITTRNVNGVASNLWK